MGDHRTLSHTLTVDHGDLTRVTVVKSGCIVHYATYLVDRTERGTTGKLLVSITLFSLLNVRSDIVLIC